MGFKKGDVLLILATNCPEYSMIFMACTALGVVVSTANPIYTPGTAYRVCNAVHVHARYKFLYTVQGAFER